MHGARLRQREAGRETEAFCFGIDGDDQLGIAVLAVDDERCFADGVSRRSAAPLGGALQTRDPESGTDCCSRSDLRCTANADPAPRPGHVSGITRLAARPDDAVGR